MKKALQLASVASMIDQFNMPNIKLLQALGYKVDVVADFTNPGNISIERSSELRKCLEDAGVRVVDIAIPRSLNLKTVISAYRKIKGLLMTEHYEMVHCHSPIGGAIARLAARKPHKNGTKVIYTAHGFHFYEGAPKKNWIFFYPIEKILSRYTDVLITINKEDYNRAVRKFKARRTIYIPGIGVDTEVYTSKNNGHVIRSELKLQNAEMMLLSVGEVNDNKNHEAVIRALSQLNSPPFYIIVGKGEKESELKVLINQLGLQDHVKLVGYRDDVVDFYDAADVFVFPSFREGLSVALMEAMASSLPVICSRIRGNIDLVDDNGGFLFEPSNIDSIANCIRKILNSDREKMGKYNSNKIRAFDLRIVEKAMSDVYMQY